MEEQKRKIELDTEEKKITYDVGDSKTVKVFVNGYKIKTDFYYDMKDENFRKMICTKEEDRLRESEIIIICRKGILEKEIRINGFIRRINIGNWE